MLRHVSFLETMAANAPEHSRHLAAQVTFLALRLFDHWLAFGVQVTAPASQSLATTSGEIARLESDAELRDVLSAITDAIAELPEADPRPVLPHLFALGALLESRGHHAQAGDVFLTLGRHADATAQRDLAYDTQMRAGDCLRQAGDCAWADQAYSQAVQLATRDRDRPRMLNAKLERAKVRWARGDLETADAAFDDLIADAEEAQSTAMTSRLLNERAALEPDAAQVARGKGAERA